MPTATGDPMVDSLVKRRDEALAKIEALKTVALENDRELSDDDLEAITTYKRDIERIDARLDVVGDDVRMSDEAAERLRKLTPAVSTPAKYRDAGQMLWDVLHQSDSDAVARLRAARRRAADHMGTLAADTATGDGSDAGDLAALYVDPIVGPTIRVDFAQMPFVNALGTRPMPGGSAFERPYIDDEGFETGVGTQTKQKLELASAHFEAASDIIKRTTLGGYLNISQQMIQWQAGSLGIVVDQMRARLSWAIEKHVVTELSNSTGVVDLAADADGATTLAAFYTASAQVFNATNQLATWALMGPSGWARLGSIVDLGGRPLLPSFGPTNAAGSMTANSFSTNGVAGLRTVVSPAITDDSFWVGNGSCIEAYLYQYPLLEAIEPSVLGRQIAVAADVVAHRPTPFANAAVHIYDAP